MGAGAEEALQLHSAHDKNSFWQQLMPWLRDVNEQDVQNMQPRTLRADDPLLTIPPLGK